MRFDELDAVPGEQLRRVAALHVDFVVAPPVLAAPAVDVRVVVAVARAQAAKS